MSCWNRKTPLIVAPGALAGLAVAPSAFGRVAPLLVVLACPIGMLVMMGAAGMCRRPGTPTGGPDATPVAADTEVAMLRREVTALRADLARQAAAPAGSDGPAADSGDVASQVRP